MPRRRPSSPAPPPRLDPRGRLERRALRAIGAMRSPGHPDRNVRIGRPVRLDGQTLDPATQAMLAVRARMNAPAWHEQSVADARATLRREALVAAGRTIPVASAEDLQVDGAAGPLPARLYRPGGVANPARTWQQPGAEALPLLVFFHGGGFVLGDLDSHDAVCRLLCRSAGVLVLSVAYRLAPEHPFPAGVDDAEAAWRWAVEHAASLGADPARLGVAGDSAGGNLSAVVALADARSAKPSMALQLLLYPAVDFVEASGSRALFSSGFYLEGGSIDWIEDLYLGTSRAGASGAAAGGPDRTDPRLSPLWAPDLSGLAPALIVTAGFDPLRDEGEAYAAALRRAGTPVLSRRMPDMIHGFANTLGVGRRSREAMQEVAALTRGMLEIAPARGGRRSG